MKMIKNYRRKSMIKELFALVGWSLLRHKYLLPVFTLTQVFLSLAIVYGLALLIPDVNNQTAIYLSSGATTLGIIAVGCVLAAQIVSTLPVSRLNILISDFIIWGMASLPGVFMSFLAAYLRFDVQIRFSMKALAILSLIQLCMISIGFALAYWLTPNVVGLATQIIMIGGLLFSPITYPTDRLPSALVNFFEFLPFVPSSNLIRSLFYEQNTVNISNIIVVCFWFVLTTLLSLISLSRRD